MRILLPALVLAIACGEEVTFEVDEHWPSASDWPGIGAGKIFVTNSGSDTLSFLDPDTLEPVYVAPTGRIPAEREGPHHGAATPDGAYYFVGISNFVPGGGSGPHGSHGTGTVDGYLLRYDTATNTLAGELRVDRSPGDVRLSPDGALAFQTHFDLQSIVEAAMDGEDPRELKSALAVTEVESMERIAMIPLCPAAHGMSLSDDGAEAYVSCWGSDELAIVDLSGDITSEAPVTRIPVGPGGGDPTGPTYGPYATIVSPDGGEVWISNLEGKSLAVYDLAAGAVDTERTVTTTGAPLFASFSATGDLLYVPVQAPDGLLSVDPATGTVVDTLSLSAEECRAPHGTLLLEDGETLALVCEGDRVEPGTVVRIDLAAEGGPVAEESFQVGVYPDDLVYIPGAP